MLRPTALCAALICGASLHAGLIGSTVDAKYEFPAGSLTIDFGSVTVSPSVEYPSAVIPVNHSFSIDIQNAAIVITYLLGNSAVGPNGVSFNGFELDFTNLAGTIVSVASDVSSTLAFRTISTSNNDVFVDLGGVIVQPNTMLTIDTTVQAVPEPATLPSVGLVLGGLALLLNYSRRRLDGSFNGRASSRNVPLKT